MWWSSVERDLVSFSLLSSSKMTSQDILRVTDDLTTSPPSLALLLQTPSLWHAVVSRSLPSLTRKDLQAALDATRRRASTGSGGGGGGGGGGGKHVEEDVYWTEGREMHTSLWYVPKTRNNILRYNLLLFSPFMCV